MGSTISLRMGMGEKLQTALDNLQYTMSASIAKDPILYAL